MKRERRPASEPASKREPTYKHPEVYTRLYTLGIHPEVYTRLYTLRYTTLYIHPCTHPEVYHPVYTLYTPEVYTLYMPPYIPPCVPCLVYMPPCVPCLVYMPPYYR